MFPSFSTFYVYLTAVPNTGHTRATSAWLKLASRLVQVLNCIMLFGSPTYMAYIPIQCYAKIVTRNINTYNVTITQADKETLWKWRSQYEWGCDANRVKRVRQDEVWYGFCIYEFLNYCKAVCSLFLLRFQLEKILWAAE